MQVFSTRSYSVRDFEEWNDKGVLELQPKFQRRNVWDPKARSYLIDTIIRGKPIPKIYMRQIVNPKTRQTRREIVDGQQRLRSVLDFLKDGFAILKIHNEDHANRFSGLDEEAQRNILQYEFSVDLLQDIPDKEVYEIFARLNTYSSTLNAQELRHARKFGDLRTCVYELSDEFITFWVNNKVFTNNNILRMAEAEFASELLMAMSEGIRAKLKRSIDKFYDDNDDHFPKRKQFERRFRETFDDIGGIMGDTLAQSNLRSTRLLYPFFCGVYHMQFKLPEFKAKRCTFKPAAYTKIRNALQVVDSLIEQKKEEERSGNPAALSTEQRKFYDAYSEHWVHADKRKTLTAYLCKQMVKAIET